MFKVYDEPRLAPAHYTSMEPCVDISGQGGGVAFPEYTGSGVPVEDHPFQPWQVFRNTSSRCGACGSENTLCIYLYYTGGVGTGKDMTLELECKDCGKYTVETYID